MTTQSIIDETTPHLTLIPQTDGPWLADPMLYFLAEGLNDLEDARKANANRLAVLTRPADKKDEDGLARGFGITKDHPAWYVVERTEQMVAALKQAEEWQIKDVEKYVKSHPLAPWMDSVPGIGWKTGARLLAVIGDPYWNDLHGRPRTVSELWAYCGYHVDAETGNAPRRMKGKKANWSAAAKMRAYLISESILRQKGQPYYDLYVARRAHTAERVHTTACVRCGPSGDPAKPGSPWSKAHAHADGMRVISKAVLKDFWLESKRLHEVRLS